MAFDFLRAGGEILTNIRKQAAANCVNLTRDAASVEVIARRLNINDVEVEGGDGDIHLGLHLRYYIVDVVDYDFGSGRVFPEAGDVIEESDGSQFEVLPIGDSGVWAYHASETSYKISTKMVKRVV